MPLLAIWHRVFFKKKVIILNNLYKFYKFKADNLGLQGYNDDAIDVYNVLKKEQQMLKSLQIIFDSGLTVIKSDVAGKCIGTVLHWKGNDDTILLANRVIEESIEKEILKEQINVLKMQIDREKPEISTLRIVWRIWLKFCRMRVLYALSMGFDI